MEALSMRINHSSKVAASVLIVTFILFAGVQLVASAPNALSALESRPPSSLPWTWIIGGLSAFVAVMLLVGRWMHQMRAQDRIQRQTPESVW